MCVETHLLKFQYMHEATFFKHAPADELYISQVKRYYRVCFFIYRLSERVTANNHASEPEFLNGKGRVISSSKILKKSLASEIKKKVNLFNSFTKG